MAIRKQFRFSDEDQKLFNLLKEELGYETDIEVIRYVLRGGSKKDYIAKTEAVLPARRAPLAVNMYEKPEKVKAPFDMCKKHNVFNHSCGGPH